MLLHLRRGGLPKSHHVLHLRRCNVRILPATTHHIEPLHGEVNRRLIGPRVMPVANDHVLWNQIHRRVRVISARLPLSRTRELAIEQTITPQPQLPCCGLQMIADRAHFIGEKFRLVAPFAARTLVLAYVEDFIHPGMKRIRLKGLAHLIHQREHHIMDLGVTRAIALAIESIWIGPGVFLGKLHLGSFVEFRMDPEQLAAVRTTLFLRNILRKKSPSLKRTSGLYFFFGMLRWTGTFLQQQFVTGRTSPELNCTNISKLCHCRVQRARPHSAPAPPAESVSASIPSRSSRA